MRGGGEGTKGANTQASEKHLRQAWASSWGCPSTGEGREDLHSGPTCRLLPASLASAPYARPALTLDIPQATKQLSSVSV